MQQSNKRRLDTETNGRPPSKRPRLSQPPPNTPNDLGEDLLNTVTYPLFSEPFRPDPALAKSVATFIFENTISGINIELEGKLGILKTIPQDGTYDDDDGDEEQPQDLLPMNLYLPRTTVLDKEFRRQHKWKFESGIEVRHFRHLNMLLNKWCDVGHGQARKQKQNPSMQKIAPEIGYKRTLLIDKMYHDKTRVSLNAETLEVAECVQKKSRDKVDIHTPDSQFDIRVSASVENEAPLPQEHWNPTMIRAKDRLSYTWGIFSLDITSIHSYENPTDPDSLVEAISETIRTNFQIKREGKKEPPRPYPDGSVRSSEVELEIKKQGHLDFLKEQGAKEDILRVSQMFVHHMETLGRVLRDLRVIPRALQSRR